MHILIVTHSALDDRTGSDQAPVDNPSTGEFVLDRKYTRDVWHALRGDRPLEARFESYLAPARALDLEGLAPTFIAVGSIDLFLEEDVNYALRLTRVGVLVELHVYPGVFHAFDLLPGEITNRFTVDLNSTIQNYLE